MGGNKLLYLQKKKKKIGVIFKIKPHMRRQCVSMPGHMGTAHSGPLKLLLPATLFSVHTLYLVGFSFSGTVNLGRSGSC